MLDLDGGIKCDIWELLVEGAHYAQRVRGAIPEIGVAEGDMLCSLGNLRSNVSEHNSCWNSEETTLVDRGDGAMQAGMLTAACSFCVACNLCHIIALQTCVAI